ncbi:MAG TPA: AAA family ATPase [Nocardioidaceae bacterium]|nr:AAA family ATPase [Nocardioidaceae bacterium]
MAILEREAQLASLQQYACEARAGAGRLVLVAGEAGVGKSTLVEELERTIPDARWCWGRCDGLFTPRPLAPLYDAAEQLGGGLGDLCTRQVPRNELFTAVLERLGDPGRRGSPTAFVVEDAHWADEATLDLLAFLGHRIRDTPTLLILTYRDDALATEPLRLVLGDLARLGTTRRVDVPALSREAVAALSTEAAVDADEVYRLTGGNPFLVGEVVAAAAGEIPPSVRDVLLARVARLSEDARGLLEAAALIGWRIEPSLLEQVAGAPTEVWDEMLASGVLTSEGRTLVFRHEIARVAVEAEIPAHRRVRVHADLLRALRTAGDTDQARLAYHAEGAGDVEAVLLLAPQAARRAAALGAHREAALQYERALRFAGEADPGLVAELSDGLGRELSLMDRWDEAAAAAEQALSWWRTVDDPVRESGTLEFLSRVMWRLCRSTESSAYAEAAVECVAGLGPSAALARAQHSMAGALGRVAKHDRALNLLRTTQSLAERLDLPDVLSDALDTEACLLLDIGQDWQAPMQRALDVAVSGAAHAQAGRAFANTHAILVNECRYGEAEQCYLDASRYCEENDLATYGVCLQSWHAEALSELGRWDEATYIARACLARPAISPANRMPAWMTLGRVLARRGDPEAWSHLDAAAAHASTSEDPDWIRKALPRRAEAHWLDGELDLARADLALAAGCADGSDGWTRGLIALWQRRLGIKRAGEGAEASGRSLPAPYRLSLAGQWSAAARAWERLSCPYESALALFDSGEQADLREALSRFEALGAEAAVRATRREMRRLGFRSVSTGARASTRAHPAGLTPRQGEVLALVCEGCTNEEIASRLFLSVRTVDHHVSAVLDKLGVPTRRAAAESARRDGLVGASR